MSRRRGYQVYDRDGFPVDTTTVPDGGRVVVLMWAMDGLDSPDNVQRQVARDAHRRKKVVARDPFGRLESEYEEEQEDAMTFDAALHRPGYRYTIDATALDAKERAYAESVRRTCDAWKGDAARPPGSYPLSPGEGTACTVDGRSGRLVKSDDGDSLVCKPVSNRTDAMPIGPVYDAAEAARIKEAVRREMVDEMCNAWRRPAHKW